MKKNANSQGFTLIELMIVVAIVAILAAIAIPAYQIYLIRAQVSEGAELTAGAKSAVWEYFANTGSYPSNNLSAGLPASPSSISGKYVQSVTVTGGIVTARFGLAANAKISNGGTFVLSAINNGGSISWSCSKSQVSPLYLPTACRQ
ncbi:type IV pilus assembly protein PilA [Rhodanobacter sp. K2T2]|uniref:pilin n=1 Tax=Rhodanobacter sp. K2T2 TaxID=2723085 RepID=UPI0015C9630F|nr:pilin [Rhodanobacter sp. K2T2]NYE28071.1 type IV pilus assembly protein PilA [Rhodanobacter sp. K2T2]